MYTSGNSHEPAQDLNNKKKSIKFCNCKGKKYSNVASAEIYDKLMEAYFLKQPHFKIFGCIRIITVLNVCKKTS